MPVMIYLIFIIIIIIIIIVIIITRGSKCQLNIYFSSVSYQNVLCSWQGECWIQYCLGDFIVTLV